MTISLDQAMVILDRHYKSLTDGTHYSTRCDDCGTGHPADPHDAVAVCVMMLWIVMHETTRVERIELGPEIIEAANAAGIQLESCKADLIGVWADPEVIDRYLEANKWGGHVAESLTDADRDEHGLVCIEEFIDAKGEKIKALSDGDGLMLTTIVTDIADRHSKMTGTRQVHRTYNGETVLYTIPGDDEIASMALEVADVESVTDAWARQLNQEGGT